MKEKEKMYLLLPFAVTPESCCWKDVMLNASMFACV